MTELQEVISNHRTIRRFKSTPVPAEHRLLMENAAQRAATSCSGQTYSFIRIEDEVLRKKVTSVCSKQRPLKEAPLLYVVCADLYRLDRISETAGGENKLGPFSGTQIAAVDAALAAQNLVLVAEDLGYGTIYIGSCADAWEELVPLLGLPKRVLPVFCIAIGVAAEDPPLRPRLDAGLIFHTNQYRLYESSELSTAIDHMSSVLAGEGYYTKYSKRDDYEWRDHVVNKFGALWIEDVERVRNNGITSQMTKR